MYIFFYFYVQFLRRFKHFPMTRTNASFFQNKIAKAGRDSSTSGMNLRAVFLSSNPEYQSSSRPSMSTRKGQADAAFSTSWKRHASFVTVTTSASARIHKLDHNSPVGQISQLINSNEIKISLAWALLLLHCNAVMQFYRDVDTFHACTKLYLDLLINSEESSQL